MVRDSSAKRRECPYDLAQAPLSGLHWSVLRDEHLALIGMPHIITDGWSLGVFVRELAALRAFMQGKHHRFSVSCNQGLRHRQQTGRGTGPCSRNRFPIGKTLHDVPQGVRLRLIGPGPCCQ